MLLRLVILILRRVLRVLVTTVVMTLFGGGRLARRVLRWVRLIGRIARL